MMFIAVGIAQSCFESLKLTNMKELFHLRRMSFSNGLSRAVHNTVIGWKRREMPVKSPQRATMVVNNISAVYTSSVMTSRGMMHMMAWAGLVIQLTSLQSLLGAQFPNAPLANGKKTRMGFI
jgi:hypothetical protein